MTSDHLWAVSCGIALGILVGVSTLVAGMVWKDRADGYSWHFIRSWLFFWRAGG